MSKTCVGFLAKIMPTRGACMIDSSTLRSYCGRGQCAIRGTGRGCSQGSLDHIEQLVSALMICLLAHRAPLTQSIVHSATLLDVQCCRPYVCRQLAIAASRCEHRSEKVVTW